MLIVLCNVFCLLLIFEALSLKELYITIFWEVLSVGNVLLFIIFGLMCLGIILFIIFAKNILGEVDRLALLLTVLANKQGCTQEDIDTALGKSAAAKKK